MLVALGRESVDNDCKTMLRFSLPYESTDQLAWNRTVEHVSIGPTQMWNNFPCKIDDYKAAQNGGQWQR